MRRSIFPILAFAAFAARTSAAACDDPGGAAIASIAVHGATVVSDEDVRSAAGVVPGDVVRPLSFAAIEESVLALGWFERVSVVLVDSPGGCALQLRVEEYGPVREVRLHGVTVLDAGALRASLETRAGIPANRRAAERDAEAIVARYRAQGFEAARVAGIDIDRRVVTITVAEGTIARIDVRGARLTGQRRVRSLLGIREGEVYSSRALVAAQAALYRTGLFSAVGFGVEPLPPGEDGPGERLVLAVTVTEHRSPFSRTEIFAGQSSGGGEARGLSSARAEASIRNAGGGHSLRALADLLAPAPDDLAASGFDEFYRVAGRGELVFFRGDDISGGALAAIDGERVHRRRREDLGLSFDADAPSISAGLELPVFQTARVRGSGGFAAVAGWRDVTAQPDGAPATEVFDGAWGRGEIGLDLREASGLATPASTLRIRAGLEMNDGLQPFSFVTAGGTLLRRIHPGHRLTAVIDAGVLSGTVPFWRETPLGGREGPPGYGRELAFARRHARGRVEYTFSAPRELVSAGAGLAAATWTGAAGARGVGGAGSGYLELRLGPEFARLRAGIALPVAARDRDPWLYAGVVVATPY